VKWWRGGGEECKKDESIDGVARKRPEKLSWGEKQEKCLEQGE
jgi:hypothetical protein